MATRAHRLNEFNVTPPPPDHPLQVLCEDHNGTYLLPYACEFTSGAWRNCTSHAAIEANVVGWREAPPARFGPDRVRQQKFTRE